MELDKRVVVDGLSARPFFPLVTQYGEHPITQSFARRLSFFPAAQSLIVKADPETPLQEDAPGKQEDESKQPEPQVTPLLISGELSWAESDPENEDLQPDPPEDLEGPLTLGVAITKEITSEQPKQGLDPPK